MKKFFTYDVKLNESLKTSLDKVIKDLNLIENVTAKVEKETLKIRFLAEEIASGNREGAEEIRGDITKVLDKYNDLKDKTEDDKKPEEVMGDEKDFTVVLDPSDVEKLKKVNDAGIEFAVTEPATVEVKERNYPKFITECLKQGIGVRDVFIKEGASDLLKEPIKNVLNKLELEITMGEKLSKDFINGAIFGIYGDDKLSTGEIAAIKEGWPKVSKIMGV